MANNKIITGVLGLAVKDDKFLLTLRNDPKHKNTHKVWQVPGGGMEFGETPEETLVREMQEEISVTPNILYPHPIVRRQIWRRKHYSVQINLLCYIVEIGTQKVIPDGIETLDFGWYNDLEIQRLRSFPLTAEFIQEAQKIHI